MIWLYLLLVDVQGNKVAMGTEMHRSVKECNEKARFYRRRFDMTAAPESRGQLITFCSRQRYVENPSPSK